MKIVHLLGWYFPDSVGGTEVYVDGLCRRLQAAGHETVVAAPDSQHVAPEHYRHDGVPVFRFGIATHATRDEANHRVPVRGAERFYRWLADERPDILHVHSFTTGVGLPEIREAHRLGIRVIVTCHLPSLAFTCRTGELMQWGAYPCDGIRIPSKCASCTLARSGMPITAAQLIGAIPLPLSARLGRMRGRLGTTLGMAASVEEYATLQREVFALTEQFVVLNETARRMLIANGAPEKKLILNRLGLSYTNIVRKPSPDQRPTQPPITLRYLGRLHASKGLGPLVDSAVAIPRDVPFRLDIRGPQMDDATRRFARELKARTGGDPRIAIGEGVAGADVPALLAASDVLLCPSIWFENGPTIALEALAVGTPIIASRVGNLPEIIDDDVNGLLVEPGDVSEWTRVLARVAMDPAATIDRWRRAIHEPRTMDHIAADYLALYGAPA
jgi:glycosyltransferase involved in cell wall biosynthesis